MPHEHHAAAFDTADAAARLALEAEMTAALDAAAIERCRTWLAGVEVRRVVDLGSGPGVAAAALAAAFPAAAVIAVDGSAAMLERAAARGLGTARLDLDGDLSPLGVVELAWASMALHHAADQRAAVARFAGLLGPGGLLCLLEHAAPAAVRLRGDDLGRPGLWERVDAAREQRRDAPADHPAWLRDTGLHVVADAVLDDTLDARRGPAVARFAADRLPREAGGLAAALDAEDAAALRGLAERGPWDAVEVRVSRRLLLARRPA